MNELTNTSRPAIPWMSRFFGSTPAPASRLGRERHVVDDEARLEVFKVDGAYAVTGRIMERNAQLTSQRHQLARGDDLLNHMLAEVQCNFLRKAAQIQADMYDPYRP
ncbi:hypothetical protein [Streptomyces geranii]|uniref:hypothetical protein n=1 Tax=Streptomyces geranii TaxID=2058923 RepID=UPI0013002A64|nr:hypothetical protein [Streptomyces geranii]